MRLPETFGKTKKSVNAIVETPRNSKYKYRYDPKLKLFVLGKMLPAGFSFPLDMGFIPRTKGDDGDPLDVLILMENPSFQGCLIECRLLGIIEAFQYKKNKKEKRNDRIIAVPENSVEYSEIKTLADLEEHKRNDIISFFEFYNEIENKKFKVKGIYGPDKAYAVIKNNLT